MELKKTNRGFTIYGEVPDSRGCIVRVQQSSAWGMEHAWIFTDDPNGVYTDGKPSPHLTKDQAKLVIEALQRFVDDRS